MITIRSAYPSDAAQVQRLLSELGYNMSTDFVRTRINELSLRSTDAIFLACKSEDIVGLLAMNCVTMLHLSEPVARITSLIVNDDIRGQGIGRKLIDIAVEKAKQAGCGIMELTSALSRKDAHAFYEAMGFDCSSYRYKLSLINI